MTCDMFVEEICSKNANTIMRFHRIFLRLLAANSAGFELLVRNELFVCGNLREECHKLDKNVRSKSLMSALVDTPT